MWMFALGAGHVSDFRRWLLQGEHRAPRGEEELKATFLGTSTLLFEDSHGAQLMVDAFIGRVYETWDDVPERYKTPPRNEADKPPPALLRF